MRLRPRGFPVFFSGRHQLDFYDVVMITIYRVVSWNLGSKSIPEPRRWDDVVATDETKQ
jgi:hypothetical protein